MPVYTCTTEQATLSADIKAALAGEITVFTRLSIMCRLPT